MHTNQISFYFYLIYYRWMWIHRLKVGSYLTFYRHVIDWWLVDGLVWKGCNYFLIRSKVLIKKTECWKHGINQISTVLHLTSLFASLSIRSILFVVKTVPTLLNEKLNSFFFSFANVNFQPDQKYHIFTCVIMQTKKTAKNTYFKYFVVFFS